MHTPLTRTGSSDIFTCTLFKKIKDIKYPAPDLVSWNSRLRSVQPTSPYCNDPSTLPYVCANGRRALTSSLICGWWVTVWIRMAPSVDGRTCTACPRFGPTPQLRPESHPYKSKLLNRIELSRILSWPKLLASTPSLPVTWRLPVCFTCSR